MTGQPQNPILIVQILVFKRPPVGNQQSVGIVSRPRHGLDISGRDQRTLQVTGAPLDELRTVVGELPFLFVEVDGVAHDGADRRRGDDVGIKAVLVHRLLLLQRRAVRHVHGLAERPLDVVVVGRQVEEILVDFLYKIAKRLDFSNLYSHSFLMVTKK